MVAEGLLEKLINFAKLITNIEEKIFSIIKHFRKSLLFDSKGRWIKKYGICLFDITMGNFDRATACKFLELMMLSKRSNLSQKENIFLYRDDGLAIVNNGTARITITINTNLAKTDFLDVRFNIAIATLQLVYQTVVSTTSKQIL